MVTTNDFALWRKMWSYKDHGKDWDAVYNRSHPEGFRWVHDSFGTNWRMLEIQAAIGRIQLRRMEGWTNARTRNAHAIWEACLPHSAVRVPGFGCDQCRGKSECAKKCGCVHGYYKCYVYVEQGRLAPGWSRDRILSEINARGVPCFQGACSEIYMEKAFDGNGSRPSARLPFARELGETSLMLLVHPTLTREEMDKTCEVLHRVLASASLQS